MFDPTPFVQAIAAAVVAQLKADGFASPAPDAPVAPPVAAPVAPPAAPAAAPEMPAPPSFLAAPPAAPALPFSDAKGLTDYTMAVYKEVGPVKGAQIQQIVTWLGRAAVSDITPDQYAQFVQAIEKLKAS